MLTSVGKPWLRHSSHPQEKEGGPKKKKNLLGPPHPFPARGYATPPTPPIQRGSIKKKKKKNTSLAHLPTPVELYPLP
jgi:hypothetical protein